MPRSPQRDIWSLSTTIGTEAELAFLPRFSLAAPGRLTASSSPPTPPAASLCLRLGATVFHFPRQERPHRPPTGMSASQFLPHALDGSTVRELLAGVRSFFYPPPTAGFTVRVFILIAVIAACVCSAPRVFGTANRN